MTSSQAWLSRIAVAAVALAAGYLAWQWLTPPSLPAGFASGNGRIEAVDIDISAKLPGRVKDILVNEGDFVTVGQVVANIDTRVLQAQLRETRAVLDQARIGIVTARSHVEQRRAEKRAALALVAQRQTEVEAARKRVARSEELAPKGNTPLQVLDDDRARYEGAKAAASAAEAQLAASEAAIGTAESQVIGAQAAHEAALATIERIQADIDDSALKAPRDGRIQYRVAQPGEVLGAGGKVLNMVDLGDVYMTFFLPTTAAGRLAIGSEVRLILDTAPQFVFPARVTFVADVAQFTPKTVETSSERLKLMFRIKANIDKALLDKNLGQVKTGLPGIAYVRTDPKLDWPANLAVKLPP
ncbi:HlyD family secretion protein [Reyranella sp.]|uniref:HlyD family secretion protein n=1 Tax=Reyranella sp. TaxID=1929291 RepID=UPI0027303E90|nr:HlyD family efflux transporter periplasmic adaptor subunit [Reyranella sp.]MDP2378086.1 HlyD family efflux transporter periplasmic adaptor subunit [Reyranella sp.]